MHRLGRCVIQGVMCGLGRCVIQGVMCRLDVVLCMVVCIDWVDM